MKPKILVSACLGFCNCRYDGSVIKNHFVNMLKDYVDFDTVCPEMGIGLPSPREAIRVVTKAGKSSLMGSYSGIDHTDAMEQYIKTFQENFDETAYDGVILKCKSPTCGIKDVKHYGNFGKVPSLMTKTNGFFGGKMKTTYKSLIVEDDGRLLNTEIRDHFLTCVFLHFEFKKIKASPSPAQDLVTFHTINKYLIMAYNQAALKRMGKIVANHEKLNMTSVIELYEKELEALYMSTLKPGKNVNMLLHLFGYFKKDLSSAEKSFFLDQLSFYEKELVSFNSLLLIIKAWVVRFEEPYLKQQTIFNHYPIELSASD